MISRPQIRRYPGHEEIDGKLISIKQSADIFRVAGVNRVGSEPGPVSGLDRLQQNGDRRCIGEPPICQGGGLQAGCDECSADSFVRMAQQQCRLRRGEYLLAVTEDQQDVGLQRMQGCGDATNRVAHRCGHGTGVVAFQTQCHAPVGSETIGLDVVDRMAESGIEVAAGNDQLNLGRRALQARQYRLQESPIGT